MAEFRFIGDPNAGWHGPELVELFGHVFCRDDWTKVEGEAAERCARHSHLERRKGGRPPKVRDEADDAARGD